MVKRYPSILKQVGVAKTEPGDENNQGLLEFVEMFKAPIKVLHPLLTATQEGNYKGTEGFGAIPFDGVVLAHGNESEWKAFRNNKNNQAFLDRIYIVNLRGDRTLTLRHTQYRDRPLAESTIEVLRHVARLWGFGVTLESVDNAGSVTRHWTVGAPA